MSDNLKEREAFEAWYEAYCMPGESDWFRRDPEWPDEYEWTHTSEAWNGWKARAATEAGRVSRDVPAGMVLVPIEPDETMESVGDMNLMCGAKDVYRAMLAASPQPQQSGAPASASVAIDYRQAVEIVEMFGGEPAEVRLIHGDGHSGPGLYAYYDELPEEGANFLGETDPEATPQPQPVQAQPSGWQHTCQLTECQGRERCNPCIAMGMNAPANQQKD